MIYDYHRRVLSPDIWSSDELRLRPAIRQAIQQQVSRRFPKRTGLYLGGDLVGHYYDEESSADIFLLVPPGAVKEYANDAAIISGHYLPNTTHEAHFHLFSNDLSPSVLADRFGPLYNISSGIWIGRRVRDTSEMTRPEALSQHLQWKIYKARNNDEEIFPYEWRVLTEAFPHLSRSDRQQMLERLKETTTRLTYNIADVIKSYNQPDIWKQGSVLYDMMEEEHLTEDEIFTFISGSNLPTPVIRAAFNRLRYLDVFERLAILDRQLRQIEEQEDMDRGVSLRMSSSKKPSPDVISCNGATYKKMTDFS